MESPSWEKKGKKLTHRWVTPNVLNNKKNVLQGCEQIYYANVNSKKACMLY